MPVINQMNKIEITPERFLNACSREELIELDMLLSSAHYQSLMTGEPAEIIEDKRLQPKQD